MSFDILESLNSALGGPITRQLGTFLGESEDSTRSAVRSVGPTLLAGMMHQATTPSGAAGLLGAINDDRIDTGIVGKLGNLLGNRGNLESMRGLGESLAGVVFGNRSGAVTSALSQAAGIKPASALSLLSMAAPVLFGMLKKQVTNNSLDSSGLASLLFSQRSSIERAGLDNRVASALGFNNLSGLLAGVPGGAGPAYATRQVSPVPEQREKRPAWLPWAIAAGVAVLGLLLLFNRTDDRSDTQTAGPTRVYFGTDETTIDSEDRIKIASVAQTAKRDDRPVTVTGYTDQTGDRATNMEVAKNRASAVRDALVAEGVAESRIVLDPPAEVTGTGTDAEARRVDIEMR